MTLLTGEHSAAYSNLLAPKFGILRFYFQWEFGDQLFGRKALQFCLVKRERSALGLSTFHICQDGTWERIAGLGIVIHSC